jgi:hypothetical protein
MKLCVSPDFSSKILFRCEESTILRFGHIVVDECGNDLMGIAFDPENVVASSSKLFVNCSDFAQLGGL